MDQFDEINKRNNRIIKIIFSIPIIIIVFLIGIFLYFLPTLLKLSEIYEIQEEYFLDEEVTEEEIEYYISGLETDEKIMDSNFLLYDQDYNLSLMELYIVNGDFDKVIARANKLSEVEENPFYNFFAGIAYLEKEEFENCIIEMNKVLDFEVYDSSQDIGSIDPIYREGIRNLKEVAETFIDYSNFSIRMGDKATIDFSDSEIQEGIQILEDAYDMDFYIKEDDDLRLLDFYLYAEDFDKIMDKTNALMKVEDKPMYHYYLGLAYFEKNKKDLAITELEEFLNYSYDSDKLVLSRSNITLANAYYDKMRFNESLEILNNVFLDVVAETEATKEFDSIVINKQDYQISASDVDQDGLSDELENVLGLNKNEKDSDGDTYEDKQEFLAGYNPAKTSPDDAITDKEYCDFYLNMMINYSIFKN